MKAALSLLDDFFGDVGGLNLSDIACFAAGNRSRLMELHYLPLFLVGDANWLGRYDLRLTGGVSQLLIKVFELHRDHVPIIMVFYLPIRMSGQACAQVVVF